jgi:hypothetical protein
MQKLGWKMKERKSFLMRNKIKYFYIMNNKESKFLLIFKKKIKIHKKRQRNFLGSTQQVYVD